MLTVLQFVSISPIELYPHSRRDQWVRSAEALLHLLVGHEVTSDNAHSPSRFSLKIISTKTIAYFMRFRWHTNQSCQILTQDFLQNNCSVTEILALRWGRGSVIG